MRYGNRNRFIQRNSIFPKKNLEKKLPWSTMKGIERETGKKNKSKTVMKEMGTERKAMKMLMRSKGSFFYFIFFPPGANDINGNNNNNSHNFWRKVRASVNARERNGGSRLVKKKLKIRREELDESPSLLAFNCHLSSCWLLIQVANPTSLSWCRGVFASLCSRLCAFDVWHWHIS